MRGLALLVGITTVGAFTAVTTTTATTEAATEARTTSSVAAESDSEGAVYLLASQKSNSVLTELTSVEDEASEEAENQESERSEDENTDPKPIVHEVERGDTLTKIAKEHDTEWIRIWHKNTDLEHPDVIQVGDELAIPFEDEELEERALPEPEPAVEEPAPQQSQTRSEPVTQTQQSSPAPAPAPQQQQRQEPARQQQASQQQQTRTAPRGSTAGNTYSRGYCTWYVKNRRPDIPNGLGNANMWLANARAMGMSTGSQPRVGAVAQTSGGAYGHVAIVESVNGDGTVTVSEMNFRGWNQVSQRTVSASSFSYIY